jgi:hypothetical protein
MEITGVVAMEIIGVAETIVVVVVETGAADSSNLSHRPTLGTTPATTTTTLASTSHTAIT